MIQSQTKLYVADNSGAKEVLCIKVIGGSKKKYANIGDIIKITVKKAISNSKAKKGEIYNALIIRTKKGVKRKDGTLLKFNKNSVILLNSKLELIGTRIFGAITKELKNEKFKKIISLASEIL